jgi:hypothetical protein
MTVNTFEQSHQNEIVAVILKKTTLLKTGIRFCY